VLQFQQLSTGAKIFFALFMLHTVIAD
jgi:hypothetical protein